MWKCKHCYKEFDFNTASEKANHTRWCTKNPKRDNWNNSIGERAKIFYNEKYGDFALYDVNCFCCGNKFQVYERTTKYNIDSKFFCSRSCANSQGGISKATKLEDIGALHYRTICFRNHEKKCIICGEEKIVEVHHFDCNNKNNSPDNLIPLCPTHHKYYHSRFKYLIEDVIINYRNNFIE